MEHNYISQSEEEMKKEKEDEWSEVCKTIEETVIGKVICIALDTLSQLKDIHLNNITRRNIKSWVKINYDENVVFLSCETNKGQLQGCHSRTSLYHEKNMTIRAEK